MRHFLGAVSFLLLGLLSAGAQSGLLVPSAAQEAYLRCGMVAYVAWGPETYLAGREENLGSLPLAMLRPASADVAQWARVLKSGGVRAGVLVAKGRDGFCLWPARAGGDYSLRAVPGAGALNLVKQFEGACRRQGLGFGVQLSLWDRRAASFAKPSYGRYLDAQWAEVLAMAEGPLLVAGHGGEWGGRGWYGGVREGRGESRRMKAEDLSLAALGASLAKRHPQAVVVGPRGLGTVERQTGTRAEASEGWRFVQRQSNGREAFVVQEVYVPLRKSLFVRDGEEPLTLDEMVEAYFKTVGRSAVLAWGVAPDATGRICAPDAARLAAFGAYVRAFEASDYARGAMVGALVGGGRETGVIVTMAKAREIDAVDFAEDLSQGPVATSWTVEALIKGEWVRLGGGQRVGARRIVCFDPVRTARLRVTCRGDRLPKISTVSVRKRPAIKGF